MSRYELLHGDCLEKLKGLADNSVDAVVTDPPYELAFMGRKWDASGIAYSVDLWREVLRVVKPGGHLLAFGGTRTYHRMACAIEDAGFEIRDSIHWLYGCLSEDTEILVNGEWCHYSKAIEGSLTLCYDVEHDSYSWQPIEQQFLYPYDDTAYRLFGERTDQLVSRNHRCLVQRNGRWQFVVAEEVARQQEARVPVLETLSELLDTFCLSQPYASKEKQTLLSVPEGTCTSAPQEDSTGSTTGDHGDILFGVREAGLEANKHITAAKEADLLSPVQRKAARIGTSEAFAQGPERLDRRELRILPHENVGREESRMEGRRDFQEKQGQLHRAEVCSLPAGVPADGSQGRVCDGASVSSCDCSGSLPGSCRSCASCGSRHAEQQPVEPNAVCDQQGPQAVRGERFTASDLVRVEPVHLTGKVWCVKVPTGAFVARRNGKVFVTGNSGFPKGLDVSKAVEAHSLSGNTSRKGIRRAIMGDEYVESAAFGKFRKGIESSMNSPRTTPPSFAPTFTVARQWAGWNVALKPAHEPIVVARKPLIGTVAENVLEWGTGALNVDGCRVGVDKRINNSSGTPGTGRMRACNLIDRGDGKTPDGRDLATALAYVEQSKHREPQEVTGRWPPNLLFSHLPECGETECAEGCAVRELDEQSGNIPTQKTRNPQPGAGGGTTNWKGKPHSMSYAGEQGGASRFFPVFRYQAKAPTKERKVEGVQGQPMLVLRDDITDEDRAFVLKRLRELGLDPEST